jgi:hypothetical protein
MTAHALNILYFHGWQSTPGGVKPCYLRDHGHNVIEPALPSDDFDESIRIAETAFRTCSPDVIVGSSRGGAVAMNMASGDTPLVLLCPAWKRWGSAITVKPGTIVLHAETDEVIPFAETLELLSNSGLEDASLIRTGEIHRLSDPDSLQRLLEAVAHAARRRQPNPS